MKATAQEYADAAAWLDGMLGEAKYEERPMRWQPGPAFSFVYDGVQSANLLPQWETERETRSLDARRTAHSIRYHDRSTGLSVQWEAIQFHDFPAVEWVVSLRNDGARDTPIIEALQALDTTVEAGARCTLHYAKGGLCSSDDFAPVTRPLNPGAALRLTPGGGRSSSAVLPFFNLETDGGGAVLGVGWTGEWATVFERDKQSILHLQAGMDLTHLRLHPGEEIRTPRILLLWWRESRWRGQNLLRQFILAHHRPQPNGQPLTMPLCGQNWGGTAAAMHLDNVEQIIAHDLPIECYWIDAEWFGDGPWWLNAGNWEPKPDLYPQGFRPLSDRLHEAGRTLLLWWEPERVCAGTPWYTAHADWLLQLPEGVERRNWGADMDDPVWTDNENWRNQIGPDDRLFDFGNPEARAFLVDFVSERITAWGIDCYRHDANIAPLSFWRGADAPDRQGMTEIRWICGLYAFWEALLERHPRLIIDNCASGGRRIDLESLSLSTPFWRTDFPRDAVVKQCHSWGLLAWVPLHATGRVYIGDDAYTFRSAWSSGMNVGLARLGDQQQHTPWRDDGSWEEARRLLTQYRELRHFYEGDYYPLTEYSQAHDAWMAYQLHLSDTGEGIVIVLKREASAFESAHFQLQGLDPDERYEIVELDTGKAEHRNGKDLGVRGLPVTLVQRPDSAVFRYRLS